MSSRNCEAEIAAFILAKGITRCPTACAAPTHASGSGDIASTPAIGLPAR